MAPGVPASLPSVLLRPSGLTPLGPAHLHFPEVVNKHLETTVGHEPCTGELLRPHQHYAQAQASRLVLTQFQSQRGQDGLPELSWPELSPPTPFSGSSGPASEPGKSAVFSTWQDMGRS